MKKSEYNNIKKSCNRNKFIMFVQTLEEVLFYYSFESYKLPALNSHYLCYDLLRTKQNIIVVQLSRQKSKTFIMN